MAFTLWVDLFSLTCSQFKLTEQSTGESLKNFEIKEKDLIIADRAYGTITSIGHCLKSGGEFIIRIKNKPFNLYNQDGEKILLSDWLNGKMFLGLLIEKYLGDIDFSPSWNIRTEPESVEGDEIGMLFDLYNVTSR